MRASIILLILALLFFVALPFLPNLSHGGTEPTAMQAILRHAFNLN